jgi:hypothetical protein
LQRAHTAPTLIEDRREAWNGRTLRHVTLDAPPIGPSVMITAITDSGGFFIFLGLATIFLV